MADALVEKVTGLDLGVVRSQQDPTVWAAAARSGDPEDPEGPEDDEPDDEVAVLVNVVVSDETLLGGGSEPGWVEGYGPVPGQVVRDWVARAEAQARAAWRRLYVCADSGALVAMDSRSRIFPKGLAGLIALRDQRCRTPWCDAPIRQTDHVVGWAQAGVTSEANGQGLCVRCNLDKEAEGWVSRPLVGPGPIGERAGPHAVEVTTPAGQREVSRAPDLPPPIRHAPAAQVVTMHMIWGGPPLELQFDDVA